MAALEGALLTQAVLLPLLLPVASPAAWSNEHFSTEEGRKDRAKEGGRPETPGGIRDLRAGGRRRRSAGERAGDRLEVGLGRRGGWLSCGLHSCTGFSPGDIFQEAGRGRIRGEPTSTTRMYVCARRTVTAHLYPVPALSAVSPVRVFSRSAPQDLEGTVTRTTRKVGRYVGVVLV